jgi:hypothetical protein
MPFNSSRERQAATIGRRFVLDRRIKTRASNRNSSTADARVNTAVARNDAA